MSAKHILIRLSGRLRRLRRDESGVAAIELSFILPVMILLLFVGIEVAQAVIVDRRANLVSRVISDLVSQGTTITNAEMNLILSAGPEIIKPFNTSRLEVIVSSVYIKSSSQANVVWSNAYRNDTYAAGHNPGAPITLPPGLMIADTYIVAAEIKYKYVPILGTFFTPTGVNLTSNTYTRPRRTDMVGRSAT